MHALKLTLQREDKESFVDEDKMQHSVKTAADEKKVWSDERMGMQCNRQAAGIYTLHTKTTAHDSNQQAQRRQ